MIYRRSQAAVGSGGLQMFGLLGRGRDVSFARVFFFFGCRSRSGSTLAAVIADAVYVHVVNDRLRVRVMDDRGVYVHDRGVVEKVSALPISALEAGANVSESVVDAAIEADICSPIASVPEIGAVAPAPISRSPEETGLGGENPGAGHPVIVAIVPSPVARRPEIAFAGTDGLCVDRQNWRRNGDRDGDTLRE